MPTCPHGHDSVNTDYCDACGAPITPATPASQASSAMPAASEAPGCSRCGTPRTGRFCEACGLDLDRPAPVAATGPAPEAVPSGGVPSGWVAVVTVDPAAEEPPAYCPERVYALDRAEIRIGRSSRSRGLAPEIDLTGPPADNGVSHLHAVLLAQRDGSWRLVDPGSTNGTRLNDAADDLPPGVAAEIADGDTIHIGGWTLITVRKDAR